MTKTKTFNRKQWVKTIEKEIHDSKGKKGDWVFIEWMCGSEEDAGFHYEKEDSHYLQHAVVNNKEKLISFLKYVKEGEDWSVIDGWKE